jgi:Zn-finger nucleic acid-binding protein
MKTKFLLSNSCPITPEERDELDKLRKKAYTTRYQKYDTEDKKDYRQRHIEKFHAYENLYNRLRKKYLKKENECIDSKQSSRD